MTGPEAQFRGRLIQTDAGHTLEPYISDDGRVGYKVQYPGSDFIGYIYLNPETGETPAVWLYMGTLDNPNEPTDDAEDTAKHFYPVEVAADFMFECDWIAAGRPE